LSTKAIGQEATNKFVIERFKERTISFRKLVEKMKLRTFSSGIKNLKIPSKSVSLIVLKKENQNLFSRMIAKLVHLVILI